MDRFLQKHDVDVGRTFGVLFLATMVAQTYGVIFGLLFADCLFLNFGIIILFFLGVGMYRHSNAARLCALVLSWVGLVLSVTFVAAKPFIKAETIVTIAGREISNPPFWRLLVAVVLILPIFWVSIAALTSRRALEEFKGAEPADGTDAASQRDGRDDG